MPYGCDALFIDDLASAYRREELDWKARAERLEAELLLTRQRLAVARMREAGQQWTDQASTDWDPTANPGEKSQMFSS